jgi:hypothetical protein
MVTRNDALGVMAAGLFCLLCLAGCESGVNGTLGRTGDDPFPEIPLVSPFIEDYTIIVSWSADEAADEYYLYRAADDSVPPQYVLVYQGPLQDYRDSFIISQAGERYLYRLGKRQGEKLFVDLETPGRAGLGVVSEDNLGIYEPNNDEGGATLLSYTALPTNLYYYESNATDHITRYDEDWYCVDIPASWKAQIEIEDADPPPYSSLTWYTFTQQGFPSQDITTTTPVEIVNTTNGMRRYYFRISPNYSLFKGMTAYNGGCGKFVYYTIKVLSMHP